jgi:GTP-binding protein Era
VSITTNVPQTTRRKVLGIYNDEDSQIIFFDTPGIHKSEKIFNAKINDVAIGSFKDSELILYFIDSSRNSGEEEVYIEEILEMVNKPALKVYTKSDLPTKIKPHLDPLLTGEGEEKIFKISSVEKKGFDELLKKIKSCLRE